MLVGSFPIRGIPSSFSLSPSPTFSHEPFLFSKEKVVAMASTNYSPSPLHSISVPEQSKATVLKTRQDLAAFHRWLQASRQQSMDVYEQIGYDANAQDTIIGIENECQAMEEAAESLWAQTAQMTSLIDRVSSISAIADRMTTSSETKQAAVDGTARIASERLLSLLAREQPVAAVSILRNLGDALPPALAAEIRAAAAVSATTVEVPATSPPPGPSQDERFMSLQNEVDRLANRKTELKLMAQKQGSQILELTKRLGTATQVNEAQNAAQLKQSERDKTKITGLEAMVNELRLENSRTLESVNTSRDTDRGQIQSLRAENDRLHVENEKLKQVRQVTADNALREQNRALDVELTRERLRAQDTLDQTAKVQSDMRLLQDRLTRTEADLSLAQQQVDAWRDRSSQLTSINKEALSNQESAYKELLELRGKFHQSHQTALATAQEAHAGTSVLLQELEDAKSTLSRKLESAKAARDREQSRADEASAQVIKIKKSWKADQDRLRVFVSQARRLAESLLVPNPASTSVPLPRPSVDSAFWDRLTATILGSSKFAAVDLPAGVKLYQPDKPWPSAVASCSPVEVVPDMTLTSAIAELALSLSNSRASWHDDCRLDTWAMLARLFELVRRYPSGGLVDAWVLRVLDQLMVSVIRDAAGSFHLKLTACFVLRLLEGRWPSAQTTRLSLTGMDLPPIHRHLLRYLVLDAAVSQDAGSCMVFMTTPDGQNMTLVCSTLTKPAPGLLLVNHASKTFCWVHFDHVATKHIKWVILRDPWTCQSIEMGISLNHLPWLTRFFPRS